MTKDQILQFSWELSDACRGSNTKDTMEIIAGLLVLSGCYFVLHQQVSLGFPPFITGVVEVVGVMSLLIEVFPLNDRFLVRSMNWRFRSGCGKGSWCVLLVHIATLLSIFQDKHIFIKDVGPVVLMAYCLSVLVISLPIQLVGVVLTDRTHHMTFLSVITFTALGLTYVMYAISMFFNRLTELEIAVIVALALWTVVVQCLVHVFFPRSFSRGEATIVSHGTFLLFAFNHLLLYRVSRRHPVRPYTITAGSDVTLFLQTAGISSLVVAVIMLAGPSLRTTLSFYGVLLGVAGAVATPILILVLDKHFVFWIYDFITRRKIRLYLFAYWGLCSIIAVYLLRWAALNLQKAKNLPPKNKRSDSEQESEESDDQREDDSDQQETTKRNEHRRKNESKYPKNSDSYVKRPHTQENIYATEEKPTYHRSAGKSVIVSRKYFHIFAIIVFLPGFIYDREMLMVASTCAIVAFIILEVMRKVQVWPLGNLLEEYFKVFVDERDSGPVILTHLYLLIGFTIPLWLYPHPLEEGIHPALLSGLLSLGVGDTAASVFGSQFGVFNWPGTKKTVEGTMASICFQIIALATLDYANLLIGVDWSIAIGGIVLTSLLEAFTSQIDNLVLPLYMYILWVDPLRSSYS